MEIKYIDKFQVQRKQTSDFLDNAHAFIEKKLEIYLRKISNCNNITLNPLGGGIKSVVYEITTNSNEHYVLKICLNKNYYWNEVVGMDLSKKAGLNTVKRFLDIEDENLNIYGFILEKVNYPILFDQFKTLSELENKSGFLKLGKSLKQMHNIKVEGYIEFKFHSYSECTSADPYYYVNYMLSEKNRNYILANNILSTSTLEQTYTYLKSYVFNEKASLTHGDFSTRNCFYMDNKEILMFDYQSAGQDPLFDVATFQYRCHLEKHDAFWTDFLDGYGHDIDTNRLNQLVGIICFRKLASTHEKGNLEEFNLALKLLKS